MVVPNAQTTYSTANSTTSTQWKAMPQRKPMASRIPSGGTTTAIIVTTWLTRLVR